MEKNQLLKRIISCFLTLTLMLCSPVEAWAQSENNISQILKNNTRVILRMNEALSNNMNIPDNGLIHGEVASNVYSDDGNVILIKEGTPAYIKYQIESNGSWGKPGKVCLTSATTKTIDNKKVVLQLNNCQRGESNQTGIIIISILIFPLGLLTGLIKGTMPEIKKGSVIEGYTLDPILFEE